MEDLTKAIHSLGTTFKENNRWSLNPSKMEEVGDPKFGIWSRLHGQALINGFPFHIEMIAVETQNGTQVTVDPELDYLLAALSRLADKPLKTMRHNGHEYVLYVVPHA
jgi:hypothetical protein